jgi:nitrate/nitrite transport system permease protein
MSIDFVSPTTNEQQDSRNASVLDAPAVDGLVTVPLGPGAPSTPGRVFGSLLWSLVGVAVAGAVWGVGSAKVDGLPSPTETLGSLGTLLANAFVDNGPNDQGIGLRLLTSLKRVFGGFAIASFVGVPFGLWMGTSTRVWRASNPVVQLLRPVSPLVWFPIWLVVFKDSGQAALWVIFVTALWPIVLNTAVGAGSIPVDQRNVAKVFKFNRRTYVRHIVLPNSLPSIVTGMRLSMGVAWMVIVAVEMMSAGSGIGTYTWDSYNAGAMDKVLSALLVIGVVGLLLDLFFLRLTKAVALKESRP